MRDDERGSAIVTVLCVAGVFALIAAALARTALAGLDGSAETAAGSAALQAAEAGVDDYIAKLTEDHSYYDHFVHPAESARRTPTGITVPAGQAWTPGTTWTYAAGRTAWRALGNGYEYNVQIGPPSAARPSVQIVAAGRRVGDPDTTKAIEAFVRPASIADFQMIANRDISYGSTATTYGKIYAGIDEHGVSHSVNHDGFAHADIHAERSITGSTRYRDGSRGFDRNTIRTRIRNPINFNTFTGALVDVQQVAVARGLVLSNSSYDAWRLDLQADGTIRVRGCTRARVGWTPQPIGSRSPTCGSATVVPVPANGAVYVAQDAIVAGTVRGRLTIATPGDLVVGGPLAYDRPGTDVIGLIAGRDMIVPQWAPDDLSWSAATLAISGQWRSWGTGGTHGTMTFTGSTATNLGGFMNQFGVRDYRYDRNLLFLQPPYFPVLEEAYTVELFREVRP